MEKPPLTVLCSDPSRPAVRFPAPDDVYQLRVTLLEVEPPIWRRLLVSQDVQLPRLHDILQRALGWKDCHLHEFKVGTVRFGRPDEDFPPGPIDHANISLNQVLPHPGASCVYEYDPGDGWEHLIELEDELPADAVTASLPWCVAGERACPPEDCGGPPGYAELLATMAAHFDPEAFDIDAVNGHLDRFRGSGRRG
jgi:hypothetical protein